MLQTDIAYIRIPLLVQGKASDAKKQLEDLLKKGATGVILDLRASAGGKDSEGYRWQIISWIPGSLGYLAGTKSSKEALPG